MPNQPFHGIARRLAPMSGNVEPVEKVENHGPFEYGEVFNEFLTTHTIHSLRDCRHFCRIISDQLSTNFFLKRIVA
jgi:hypothetical protein